jgi:hypothetical protein
MLLDGLRRANPGLTLFSSADPEFAPYGELVEGSWPALVAALEAHAPIPEQGVVYVGSHPHLEDCADAERMRSLVFGGLPVQLGYCSGRNSTLNGLEYHKASEVIVAADDLVLLLALRGQLRPGTQGPGLDSSDTVGLFLRRGEAVELYSGTMHLAPCRAHEAGFRAAIVLPRGTNDAFAEGERPDGDPLLRKFNKWIIAHPERKPLIDQGVLPLLRGENRLVRLPTGEA